MRLRSTARAAVVASAVLLGAGAGGTAFAAPADSPATSGGATSTNGSDTAGGTKAADGAKNPEGEVSVLKGNDKPDTGGITGNSKGNSLGGKALDALTGGGDGLL
ncbi:hypothetical protein [Streptomyces sp. HNM0574]|uniref:hypothetical protein n=1 Tax=Streptomyces sp. HNM0574 TaxID=2714954 RepID=UPI00146A5B23|nr:hypothetical protein [Streptomyces sp. HNM0574]NLU70888.1 hypothetical protein [Streptomyces sp. HNM0574]